ncbi:MAG: hypothetical protein J6386_22570 [Candidatus Synoicihabitans palmerolidicus]|nr:hypothetical protein [Candidatus Synoicihabitans palmerolidicus]
MRWGICVVGAMAVPRQVKVVVVVMFEIGADTGDTAGEMQRWVERGEFDEKMPFPLGHRDGYWREDGTLLICTGGGVTTATATIMALGLDTRFDLSEAYWVVTGIAGGQIRRTVRWGRRRGRDGWSMAI